MSDFKIGDRVRAKHEPGWVGVVTVELCDDGAIYVRSGKTERNIIAPASWFERVPEPQTAEMNVAALAMKRGHAIASAINDIYNGELSRALRILHEAIDAPEPAPPPEKPEPNPWRCAHIFPDSGGYCHLAPEQHRGNHAFVPPAKPEVPVEVALEVQRDIRESMRGYRDGHHDREWMNAVEAFFDSIIQSAEKKP